MADRPTQRDDETADSRLPHWMREAWRQICNQTEPHDRVARASNLLALAYARIEALEAEKNGAYTERDRLVCALSKCFTSWLERHPDADTEWEDDWRWIVFVDRGDSQMSWHIHDSELSWFDHLERRDGNSWNGHTTEEKYERLGVMPNWPHGGLSLQECGKV